MRFLRALELLLSAVSPFWARGFPAHFRALFPRIVFPRSLFHIFLIKPAGARAVFSLRGLSQRAAFSLSAEAGRHRGSSLTLGGSSSGGSNKGRAIKSSAQRGAAGREHPRRPRWRKRPSGGGGAPRRENPSAEEEGAGVADRACLREATSGAPPL